MKLERLQGHHFLLSGGGCEDHIYRLFEDAGIPLPDHLLVRQMDTIQAMVTERLAVSLVPSLTLTRKPENVRTLGLVPRRYRTIGGLLALDIRLDDMGRGHPESTTPTLTLRRCAAALA